MDPLAAPAFSFVEIANALRTDYFIGAMGAPTRDTDFFISYRGARTDWAVWINWVVRSAGYSTILMDEFPTGTAWTSQMRVASERCCRLIPLYSRDYWKSGACCAEFDAYWHQHLKNETEQYLLPIEIQTCDVPIIHQPILAKRLQDLEHDAARTAILAVLKGINPITSTPFTDPEPPFPGKVSPTAHTPVAADWPDTAPDKLHWPLANHDEARDAFATLVTRSSPYQFLAIRGESETGKTHLTRQFFSNASRLLENCFCGRLDFKGTGDLQASVAEFSTQLSVDVPAANLDLIAQLRAILCILAIRQKPSLLIFDAYEYAGEADRWVKESLLTSLHRNPWLRVVVAGKSVPDCHGQVWDQDSKIIPLQPPSPDQWHAWGLKNQRNLDLDFAKQAHTACNGKASILTGLFGPKS